ncbi:MAG: sirohydrochlorin nickelochelatase [Methanomassiliicoccales archaeon]|jgi:sirohydrochlorin cobaltochelatase
MKSGVLIVGHGSKLKFNKDLVVDMAKILDKKQEFGPVTASFMQINKPDIMDGLKVLVAKGVDTIYVQPCFLASGIHLTEDIPGALGLSKDQAGGKMTVDGKEVTLRYCGPIGADHRIADILSDRIRERAKKG